MEKVLTRIEHIRALLRDDPGRWPLSFRLSAVGVVFMFAAGLFSYLIAIRDQGPELENVRAEEKNLLLRLESKARKAANLQPYTLQLKEMQQTFGSMLRQLPDKTEVPTLLVDISQTGIASGLEEKLFQPGTEMKKEFYAELPIKIRLTGSYHAIGNFVSGIAALPRIVTLHDFQIIPIANKSATADQLQLDLIAKTYRYLDEEEQAEITNQQRKIKKSSH